MEIARCSSEGGWRDQADADPQTRGETAALGDLSRPERQMQIYSERRLVLSRNSGTRDRLVLIQYSVVPRPWNGTLESFVTKSSHCHLHW